MLAAHRHLPLLALMAALLRTCGVPTDHPSTVAASGSAIPTVRIAQNAGLGWILVDTTGRTLYLSIDDPPDVSSCTGHCTTTWMALTVPPGAKPTGGRGVRAIGVTRRPDGTWQVKVGTSPLYLYVPDGGEPGSAKGQGIDQTWYAVLPTGNPDISAATALALQSDVRVATNADLGDILVDREGMTLYLNTGDAPGFSTCGGGCAKIWPPLDFPDPTPSYWRWSPFLPPSNTPTGAPGVTGRLGTLNRPGGTPQITINGQPLYRYAADQVPGDTRGEGVGEEWFAVRPSGAEVGAFGSGSEPGGQG